jgi:hypothetical protein
MVPPNGTSALAGPPPGQRPTLSQPNQKSPPERGSVTRRTIVLQKPYKMHVSVL